jgi:hypothetical protein
VVALILFPFLDAFRYEHAVAHAHSGIVQTYLNKTDYSSPQDVTNVVSYVGQYGHTGGRQLLGTALFAVPRSVWPDKPTDTAIVVAHYVNSHLLNLDSPLWAEGYIDFGIPGAALMLGVFGMLAGRADVHLLSRERSSAVAVLTPAFVGYELILLRGSLLQAMGRITLIVLFAYLLSEKQVTRVRGI